ncbi:hypothetical protein WJX64_12395 [Leifsonia sp. YIM 134122]|uniref:Dinucleotide-utilizing enzyme n=1 Tax=Leifsonia stereocauli TaxID=3134136 RepID=A0ABU9W5T0_9MICO
MTGERRAPSKMRSIVVGGVFVIVGLLCAVAAVVIAARAGGDLSTVVGSGGANRTGGAAPAWFAIGITAVLALLACVTGVFVAIVGWRAADSAEREADR